VLKTMRNDPHLGLARRPGRSIRFGERLPDLPNNTVASKAAREQYENSQHFDDAFHTAESVSARTTNQQEDR
jgi:hypothetical protein